MVVKAAGAWPLFYLGKRNFVTPEKGSRYYTQHRGRPPGEFGAIFGEHAPLNGHSWPVRALRVKKIGAGY